MYCMCVCLLVCVELFSLLHWEEYVKHPVYVYVCRDVLEQ